jgi:hypothetical protein
MDVPVSVYVELDNRRKRSEQLGYGTTYAGIPVYSAHFPDQYGGAWWQTAWNFLKKPIVRNIGKQLLTSGLQTVSDISKLPPSEQNKNDTKQRVGRIMRKRFAEGGANLLDLGSQYLKNISEQTGSGCGKWSTRRRRRGIKRMINTEFPFKKRRRKRRKITMKKSYKRVRRGRVRKQKSRRRRTVRKQRRKKSKKTQRRRRRGRKRKAPADDFYLN